jgi:hypothetical protein
MIRNAFDLMLLRFARLTYWSPCTVSPIGQSRERP